MKKILLIIAITFLIFQMVVLATVINIGLEATNRSVDAGVYTWVNKNNPANDSGTITSIEIWANLTLSNCKVATFFVVSGDTLSTRDWEAIGTVTAGSKQTIGVSINVETGDYIGIYYTDGKIEADGTGYGGVWYFVAGGDRIPCTGVTFSLIGGYGISLKGIGTTEEEEANAIFFGTNF